MTRRNIRTALKRIGIAATALALVASIGVAAIAHRIGPPPLGNADLQSVIVTDRNGELLRAYTTEDGRWRLPIAVKDVDPIYLAMLFAFEDQRFRLHHGIDPRGVLRVASEVARRGRLISGGSTLTMQTARLLDGVHEKTGAGKLRQMVRALQLERRLTKDEILALYLKLAPFGGNIEGVRAASLLYLGKEPRRLSLDEAALLVALPQGPNARRPDRHAKAARIARDRVLARAIEAGVISKAEGEAAMRVAVPTERRIMPQFAAHLADELIETQRARRIHATTLDRRAQAALEALTTDYVKSLGPGVSAAIVAVDHVRGEIVAQVASAGYQDTARSGAVDMVRAIRSPGSTLKPLIYGLAFDAGLAHPETLIEDRPQRFGLYTPKNFDRDWHGTVTIREALAQSLNIPAVAVLDAVGPHKLQSRLASLGFTPVLPKNSEPSLAMALGGVGLRLTDLATLYAAIARGGDGVTLLTTRPALTVATSRIMSPVAAYYLREVLRHAPPPVNAPRGEIAYKTGTSYGHRDAWSVGFDGRHTIAVWVGRADGAPVPGLNGRATAAPLLFDAFKRLAERRTAFAPAPAGVIAGVNSQLPAPLQRFAARQDNANDAAEPAPSITFPPDRSEIEAQPSDGGALTARAEGGTLPLTWLVDGLPVPSDPTEREALLDGLGQGFVKLTVIDARGRSDRATVRLK